MNKYDNLIELRDKFLEQLNTCVKNAKTQDDFDELETITEDVFNGMPLEITSCDYIMRSVVQSYLDDNDQKDMVAVNKFMKQIWNDNVFHFNDDFIYDDLTYAAEKFYDKGGDNGNKI